MKVMNPVNCVPQIPVIFQENTPINDNQAHRMMTLEEVYPHLNVNNIKVISDYKFLQNIKIDNYSEYICNLKADEMALQENNLNGNYHLVPNVPLNLMPPPPHNMMNNNLITGNFDRRGNWRSRGELRSGSPTGSESDESCRSFTSRESPANIRRNAFLLITIYFFCKNINYRQ